MASQFLARPFAALRPTAESAADVIAPPYDVVRTDQARALAANRPASFLHISRPEIDLPPGSSPYSDAAYERGAENLARLREGGVLVREREPSFYIYRMVMNGRAQTGVAFAASVAAYQANRIRRHELTRPDKEKDRVRNIATLNAQTGPVLLAYRANAALAELIDAAAAAKALFSVPGPNDVVHTVWRVAARAKIEALGTALDALDTLYIADGHHRSAAAARVALQRRAAHAPLASHELFLAVAFPHDEVRILAYNRVVADLSGLSPDALLAKVGASFAVEPSAAAVQPAEPETFGMFVADRWYRLRIRPEFVPRADPVASLDVRCIIGPGHSLLQEAAVPHGDGGTGSKDRPQASARRDSHGALCSDRRLLGMEQHLHRRRERPDCSRGEGEERARGRGRFLSCERADLRPCRPRGGTVVTVAARWPGRGGAAGDLHRDASRQGRRSRR